MKKAICLTAALLLLCFAVPSTAERAGYPTVAVSFLPIGIFADNVLKGTEAEIILLAPEASGCLHDYQLLPGDLTRLSSADILLINGAGMESFLPDIRDVYPNLMIADCSEGIELMSDESDEGEYNSHIWLSPRNAGIMVRNIADALAEIDSAHAEEYSANADAYIGELQSLDAELKARCERLSRRDIVTFHEAFPYFARDYGLNVLAVIAPEPDEGVSPRRLASLTDLIRQHGNPPLFIEAQYPSEAALALSKETGSEVYELETVTGGGIRGDAYQEALRRNIETLEEALGTEE